MVMLNQQLFDFEKSLGQSVLQQIEAPFIKEKGIELWMKRDDLLHPIVSGNKWRKLKYVLNDALSVEAQRLISMGGAYSNHLHALAYVGHCLGLPTAAYIRGECPKHLNPSLVDMQQWGMRLHYVTRSDYQLLRQQGLASYQQGDYWIPEGGSLTPALQGVAELLTEIDIDYDVLCVPCGTATTLAGLVSALPDTKKIIGFAALKGAGFLVDDVQKMLNKVACHNNDWLVNLNYHFGGFAKTKPELHDFIDDFEQQQQILLEPIYTGKMLYGIYDLIKQGYFQAGQRIIALHTGGLQGKRGFTAKHNKEMKKYDHSRINRS